MSNTTKFPYGETITRAFTDSDYLRQLLENPREALAQTGVTLDEGVIVEASMNGGVAGGALSIEVKNAAVNWAGSVNLTLHK
jgi:uncharacterized protein YuzE